MQNSECRAQNGDGKPRDASEPGKQDNRSSDDGQDSPSADEARNNSTRGTPRAHAPQEIGERTLDYGVRAIRLFRALQARPDRSGRIIGRQFLRAATSIGANVAEARSGESRKDFAHKLQIAQGSPREPLLAPTHRALRVARQIKPRAPSTGDRRDHRHPRIHHPLHPANADLLTCRPD
jgi:four helix bundle protein